MYKQLVVRAILTQSNFHASVKEKKKGAKETFNAIDIRRIDRSSQHFNAHVILFHFHRR